MTCDVNFFKWTFSFLKKLWCFFARSFKRASKDVRSHIDHKFMNNGMNSYKHSLRIDIILRDFPDKQGIGESKRP